MPVPSLITDLSQTAGSNYPSGGDSPSTLDDVQRAHASFIALLRDGKGQSAPVSLASAATVDIGAQNSQFVEITGTTGITSFGTTYNGPRYLRFQGVLTLTHNGTTLNLPGAANITTAAGDVLVAVPNLAQNGWNVIDYQLTASAPGVAVSAASATSATNATNATNLTGSGTISSTATGTTKSFGTSDTTMATTAFVDALRDVPANSQSTSYTLALTDRGKSIDFTGSTGQTITVPANASVAFPVGSVVTITNTTANNLAIAITTDTLRQAGTANTGARTLGQYGVVTLRKVASTTWIIGGSGLT